MHERILSVVMRPFRAKPKVAVSVRKLVALDAVVLWFNWRENKAMFNVGDGAGGATS